MYISEQEKFNDFDNPDALFWVEEELVYGDWTSGMNGDGSYEKKSVLPISEVRAPGENTPQNHAEAKMITDVLLCSISFQRVQNNGTIFLHLYFVQAGSSPNPEDENYSERKTIYRSKRECYSDATGLLVAMRLSQICGPSAFSETRLVLRTEPPIDAAKSSSRGRRLRSPTISACDITS